VFDICVPAANESGGCLRGPGQSVPFIQERTEAEGPPCHYIAPYLNRQTYIKDAWLRLWFLGRDPHEIAKPSLETGNVIQFVQGMIATMESISRSVRTKGTVVLVCGRASITVGGKPHSVRISDLCLLANSKVAEKWRFRPDRPIIDRKIMKPRFLLRSSPR
jgi:hypothetical protein